MATGTKKMLRLGALRAARKEAGLSLRELEERTAARGQRVYSSTISDLENGKRGANRSTAERLSGALGVTVGMLTGEVPLDAAVVLARPASGAEKIAPADAAALEEFDHFAAMLAAAQGITKREALGSMMEEKMRQATDGLLPKPPLRPREEMPKIAAGGLTAAAAVSADRA